MDFMLCVAGTSFKETTCLAGKSVSGAGLAAKRDLLATESRHPLDGHLIFEVSHRFAQGTQPGSVGVEDRRDDQHVLAVFARAVSSARNGDSRSPLSVAIRVRWNMTAFGERVVFLQTQPSRLILIGRLRRQHQNRRAAKRTGTFGQRVGDREHLGSDVGRDRLGRGGCWAVR